ncbi:E3 ubiquitin-protein ligase Trim36 [Biomphalaria glabrata]|nr:E3 ubiquitin-protein ligase Trim36-like [Biomphalaria glabrata]
MLCCCHFRFLSMSTMFNSTTNCLLVKTQENISSQDVNFVEMEEELTCPVCLELFADPLMLPCSHSICKTCLLDIMKCRSKQGKDGMECPACRESHKLIADQINKLPKNLALENIVFRYQEIRSHNMSKAGKLLYKESDVNDCQDKPDSPSTNNSDEFLCGMCEGPDKNPADWFCSQCTVLYCQNCLGKYHPKRGPLSKHKLMKPMMKETLESSIHCPDHECEVASIFCGTCKVVACHLCVCQGIGQHCSHIILDLETAKKHLQEALLKAKGDLDTIINSIAKKDSTVNTKLQFIKSLEMCAVSNISSQCNCILADVAQTLELARKKSVRSILDISSKHSSNLVSSSQQIKSLLSQCQNLEAVCKDLLGMQKSETLSCPSANAQSQRHFSSPAICLSETMSSSAEIAEYSDPFSESQDIRVSSAEPLDRDRDKIKNGDSEGNKQQEGKKRASSDSINLRLSSQKSVEDRSPKQNCVSTRTFYTPVKEKPNALVEDDLARTRKSVVDQKNSERKMSAGQIGLKKLLAGEIGMSDLKDKVSFELGSDKDRDTSEDMLLQRADEVDPIIQHIATLSKESESDQMPDLQDTQLSDDEAKINNCVLSFHATTLALLSNISDDTEMDCPIITPSIRSVVSPANVSGAPRVQNRLLITWGFSSNTFTAEPIEHSAQWSVHISRNANHFGDIKSGYLFGVGVSTKPLNSKDQVGMTSESDGIVCVNGQLALCQDSQLNIISPLRDLPVVITLYVDKNHLGYIMAYKITFSDSSSSVRGKRLIQLLPDESPDSVDKQNVPEVKVYPVFTLSQRVKMQFPLSSDV